MARTAYPVHFANFICHFGEKELLDYLTQIVLPGFLGNHKRTFKDTKYFFHQVSVIDLGADESVSEPAICGRYVKDMVVRSEQRFDSLTGELEKSQERLETAPSAVFALLLASHKLLYMHETVAAPGLDSFRSTAESFLKQARNAYIDELHAAYKAGQEIEPVIAQAMHELDVSDASVPNEPLQRLTKTRLRELIAVPSLEVVPLANEDTLRQFVNRFKVLQTASVRLLKRNSELDNDDFFESVRTKGRGAGAETATVTYRNSDGLAKEGVVAQLEAALSGNAEVKLDGKDDLGQQLRGSNDEFKVVAQLESRPTSIKDAALRMLRIFRREQAAGLIRTAGNADERRKADEIRATLQRISE